MKKILKMFIPKSLVSYIRTKITENETKRLARMDMVRFVKYSFGAQRNLDSFEQYEAKITKLYHSIEKGLSYQNIRLGFGKDVIDSLLLLMDNYKQSGFPLDAEFYSTALSNLYEYIGLHDETQYDVALLKKRVEKLGGKPNDAGGSFLYSKGDLLKKSKADFIDFSMSRHSVRDFSSEPVNLELIKNAINLAQNTPSACNRQGWKVRVIINDQLKKIIESNQNGNRGFGEKIDKFLLITTDSQYFAKPRERNQPYIDGGMYAMNLLYSLHYYNIATIPLSASLTLNQETNIRKSLNIKESENFILIIGIGNYADSFKVPKSTRKTPDVEIIS